MNFCIYIFYALVRIEYTLISLESETLALISEQLVPGSLCLFGRDGCGIVWPKGTRGTWDAECRKTGVRYGAPDDV